MKTVRFCSSVIKIKEGMLFYEITGSHLAITGHVPGLNAQDFEAISKEAEKDCIISRALNFAITSEVQFSN